MSLLLLLSQIFTKLVTAPYIFVDIFCTKLHTNWTKNVENTGNFYLRPQVKHNFRSTIFKKFKITK